MNLHATPIFRTVEAMVTIWAGPSTYLIVAGEFNIHAIRVVILPASGAVAVTPQPGRLAPSPHRDETSHDHQGDH